MGYENHPLGKGEEIDELFKIGKNKNKTERSVVEILLDVQNVMAELEAVAEEDAELNQLGKPTISKLKKLSHFIDAVPKKQLQHEFLDHGELKNWFECLPVNVRAAVLKILDDLPIDLKQYDQREQLKRSGLKKVIMFLSKSDEETTANRILAKKLVHKWFRSTFNKSTRFEDRKVFDEEINELFRIENKNWRKESEAAKIAYDVEKVMAELELDAEDDTYLNWLGKPAVNKLKELSHLANVLSKKQLQHEFLDHGVLSLLNNWLEPLPDGSLPNVDVRVAVLKILDDMNKKLQQLKAPKLKQQSSAWRVVTW